MTITKNPAELTFEAAVEEARTILADLESERPDLVSRVGTFLVEADALEETTDDPEILVPALAFEATDIKRSPTTVPEFAGWIVRVLGGYLRPDENGELFGWSEEFREKIEAAIAEDRIGRGRCRECAEPVLWARTENRKNIPLDPEPRYLDEGATFVLELDTGLAVHWRAHYDQNPDTCLFRCHLERCHPDD